MMTTTTTTTQQDLPLDALTVGEPMALFMALQPGDLHAVPDFAAWRPVPS